MDDEREYIEEEESSDEEWPGEEWSGDLFKDEEQELSITAGKEVAGYEAGFFNDDFYKNDGYSDDAYIDDNYHENGDPDDEGYGDEEYDEEYVEDGYSDEEYYEDENANEDAQDVYEVNKEYDPESNEWTVVTQNFYEQYGDEMRSSLRELDAEKIDEIYEEYEEAETGEQDDTEPQRPRKKRKKKHYLRKFLGLVAVLTILIAIALSPIFNIEEIKVEGAENNDAKKIVKSSGIKKGENIFRVRRGTVADNLKENAYLSSVDIKRDLPGTITIVVKERKEMSYIVYGKEYVVLDMNGFVLRKATKKPKLTELANMKIKEMDIGRAIEVTDDVALDQTLDIIKTMDKADLFFKRIVPKGTITRAYFRDKFLIKGRPENIVKNMENGNVATILADLKKKDKNTGTIILSDDEYCSYSPKVE